MDAESRDVAGKAGMVGKKPKRLPRRLRPGGVRRLDGRSSIYKELHGDYIAVAEQLGGEAQLTPVQRWLIESLAFANAWRRRLETQAVESRSLDVGRYVSLVDRV